MRLRGKILQNISVATVSSLELSQQPTATVVTNLAASQDSWEMERPCMYVYAYCNITVCKDVTRSSYSTCSACNMTCYTWQMPSRAHRYQNLFISISNKQFISIITIYRYIVLTTVVRTNFKEFCHSDSTNPCKVGWYIFKCENRFEVLPLLSCTL